MPDAAAASKEIIHHDEHLADRAVMLTMRAMLKLHPPVPFEPDARPASDTMMANIASADGVTYDPAVLGGVQGWWCRPAGARQHAAILHLHGGAYVVGSAWAYRHFVGQIAARAGAAAFVPDYALAPERPFPAGPDDALAVYDALAHDHEAVAVIGDSAGGGLALGLLSRIGASDRVAPRCGVLLSPWADLSLSGESMETRAGADPLLSREALAGAAALYVGAADPRDPHVSPLFGEMGGLPPMLLHVGDDEVLRDDTLRIAQRLGAAGIPVEAHVWKGMPHVFPASFASVKAAAEAMTSVGDFLRRWLDR